MSSRAESFDEYAALARELGGIASRRAARAAIHSRAAMFTAPSDRSASDAGDPLETATTIGIWRARVIEGRTWFVRDDSRRAQFHLWADVDRIPPKGSRRRLILAGESCARAWPLDPLFNCATALRAYLDAALDGDGVEIVDLARSGSGSDLLAQLLGASHALAPDAFVVFAGNNWHLPPRRVDVDDLESTLTRTQSWRALLSHCLEAVRREIARRMARVADACRDVPAVFVIPAQNMQDCPVPTDLYNPLLGSDDQAARERLIARIERLFAHGAVSEAETVARELVALEDGVSMVGLETLARCALARGAHGEAVQLFERARDCVDCLPGRGRDRGLPAWITSYSTRTEALRSSAADAGLAVVDLPRYFLEQTGGVPPGRDFFVDDCHMTAEGIVTAMCATAERVLPLLGRPTTVPDRRLDLRIEVDPRAEAQAHCVAAIRHVRATSRQTAIVHDEDLARYHWARALDRSPEIVEVMRSYLDLILRRSPLEAWHKLTALARSFPALRGLERVESGPLPLSPTDLTLMRIAGPDVAAIDPDARREWGAAIERSRSIRTAETDLLPFVVTDEATRYQSVTRAYMKCFRRRTRFEIVAGRSPRPLRLRLTARVPHAQARSDAWLLVNGITVDLWPVGVEWSTVECAITTRMLHQGLNVLTIVWPDPAQRQTDRLQHVARALTTTIFDAQPSGDGCMPESYTVYGEVAAFTGSPSTDAQPDPASHARRDVPFTT